MEQRSCCCRPSPNHRDPGYLRRTAAVRSARGAHLARSPGSLACPSQPGRSDCGIRRQTLKLAPWQTTESATPSAYPELVASIERSSGCSSLAIPGRANRKASDGRTHFRIDVSGLGPPTIGQHPPLHDQPGVRIGSATSRTRTGWFRRRCQAVSRVGMSLVTCSSARKARIKSAVRAGFSSGRAWEVPGTMASCP